MIRVSRTWLISGIFISALILYRVYLDSGSSKANYAIDGTRSSPVVQDKANACFVILIRNKELRGWLKSMTQLEERFNRRHEYPYVFLNNVPFTQEFKKSVQKLTNATVEFGLVPSEHWSYPPYIDQEEAKNSRDQMKKDGVLYGDMESYHHMCRFESGFFFRHNLTLKYDYYWRVEPDVSFTCDIDQDPFLFMKTNNKKYGFTISLREYENTIPTLWTSINDWLDLKDLRQKLPKDNALPFISDDGGETYNRCHFWTNFEIASFDLWRDQQYLDYFDYLDHVGGFFYERWGDAPVHSIYASLVLSKDEIHFFNSIGYKHPPYQHCPVEPHLNLKCHCDPKENFDYEGLSCNKEWFKLIGHK